MSIGGGGVLAPTLAAPAAPEIPSLLMQLLLIAEPRSFSDSSSLLLFLLLFIQSVPVSNVAIAVAFASCKNLVALSSTRHYR